MTYYNQCIVLIDTVEGLIFSRKVVKTDKVVSKYSSKEAHKVITK